MRLAEVTRLLPVMTPLKPLSQDQRDEKMKQLGGFADELGATRLKAADDRKRLNESQQGADSELENAARALQNASQVISRRDTVQFREFVRMARAFDRATRVGGNLRAARDMAEETMADLTRFIRLIRLAVEQ